MIILPSALKHGISETDIQAALNYPFHTWTESTDPLKVLIIGLSTNLNTIEVCYTTTDNGETLVFHAMNCPTATINRLKRARRT